WAGGFFLTKGDFLEKQGRPGKPQYERARAILLRCLAIDKALEDARGPRQTRAAASAPEANRLLSAVFFSLGDVAQTGPAADRARTLDPMSPEPYHQLAEVLLAKNDGDGAAIRLMEGFLLTSDVGLRDDLMTLYRGGLDTKACAIATGPNGPAMNPGCEMV